MMTALFYHPLVLFLMSPVFGQARLDRPLYVGDTTEQLLQYDDATAAWMIWDGLYRGTWFNTNDFGIVPSQWPVINSQLWFFHHSSYPWDTSSFYCELYNGDQASPTAQLDQTSVTAIHFQPVYVDYLLEVEENFWVLINTEMSSGGWPSVVGDDTPNWTGSSHSFFSDDFIVWEPWVLQGPAANDFFIRVYGGWALQDNTWGAIKALF